MSEHLFDLFRLELLADLAPEYLPYDEFIERVKTNPLAVAVKINDLTDNMDVRRYKELTDWDVKRLRKYLKAYQALTCHPHPEARETPVLGVSWVTQT